MLCFRSRSFDLEVFKEAGPAQGGSELFQGRLSEWKGKIIIYYKFE